MIPEGFEVEWYSGTGKGGQHRNKHENCCRLTHLATGLMCVGTGHRERSANVREALRRLTAKIAVASARHKARRHANEVVRTYHFERGEVIDNATGLRRPVDAVMSGGLDDFVLSPEREGERPQTGRL